MKVILDTNVIVAAFAAHGLCHLVLENVLAQSDLIISEFILQEVSGALRRKIRLPQVRVTEIITFLRTHGSFAKDSPVDGIECRDESDLKILFLAANASADVIVTGDQDLLVLKAIPTTAILSPREFWDMLRSK